MARRINKVTTIPLLPNQRFAIVGKTGSGKTTFATLLASILVPDHDPDWEIWWIDTKGDPTDIARLRRFGFISREQQGRSAGEQYQGQRINRVYWRLNETENDPVQDQAQRIIHLAIEQKKVLVVIDEYTQVVSNTKTPGKWLGDAFRTGRGLNVGIIGCTQEPVYVPRQLLSQASHIFLFDLFYDYDIQVAQKMFPEYVRPKDIHGFFTAYVDGRAPWRYYVDARQWAATIKEPAARITSQASNNIQENPTVG